MSAPGKRFVAICVRLCLLLGTAGLAPCCTNSASGVEYPETKVNGRSFELQLTDSRKKLFDRFAEMVSLDRGDELTYPQALLPDAKAQLQARLTRVSAGHGPVLKVQAEVRRCDVTFYNSIDGNFARYDVVLGFRVNAPSGAMLVKGSGGAWRQIPEDQVNEKTLERALAEATSAAMDQYWASEDNTEKLNDELERYLQTHPNDR
ncbi:MAG TPA: hypothetical protein VHM70_15730 [Polyangiaceae bacterium]|jgi:hypothetical protein|nr:hypothetical protein [Polyangiaceae bacterium]